MIRIKTCIATLTLHTLLTILAWGDTQPPIWLVTHGGVGTTTKDTIIPEQEKQYTEKLIEALSVGYAALNKGNSNLEAVQEAINVMEDSPPFNAGKGVVLTYDGRNELDVSTTDGKSRKAGVVAGVITVENPTNVAYAVMTQSPHILMVPIGTDTFAKEQGLTIANPAYFRIDSRRQQLQDATKRERVLLDHDGKNAALSTDLMMYGYKYGTVGAVVLDKEGNLVAGASIDGMTNKRYGRVGDSPIVGAGNYADNEIVAASATGSGEMFIRTLTAYNIAAQVKYCSISLKDAAQNTLDEVKALNGSGGVIALDKAGNHTMSLNSEGMYRGTIGNGGRSVVAIYR